MVKTNKNLQIESEETDNDKIKSETQKKGNICPTLPSQNDTPADHLSDNECLNEKWLNKYKNCGSIYLKIWNTF